MTAAQIQLALTELRLQRHSIEVQMIDVEEQVSLMNFYEREGATMEVESTLYWLKMNLENLDDEIAKLEEEIEG